MLLAMTASILSVTRGAGLRDDLHGTAAVVVEVSPALRVSVSVESKTSFRLSVDFVTRPPLFSFLISTATPARVSVSWSFVPATAQARMLAPHCVPCPVCVVSGFNLTLACVGRRVPCRGGSAAVLEPGLMGARLMSNFTRINGPEGAGIRTTHPTGVSRYKKAGICFLGSKMGVRSTF